MPTHLAKASGDLWAIGLTYLYWAWHITELGDYKRAEALTHIFVDANRKSGSLSDLTSGLFDLSDLCLQQLQFQKALDYAEQSLALAREVNHIVNEVRARVWMAECYRHLGDGSRATQLSQEALDIARERLVASMTLLPLRTLVKALNDAGDVVRATELVCAEFRDPRPSLYAHIQHRRPEFLFDVMACIASRQGNFDRCTQLTGCADAELASIKKKRFPYNEWDYAPYFSKARDALGEMAYEAARERGRVMTPAQAIEYALEC